MADAGETTLDDTDTAYLEYGGTGWSREIASNPSWNANFYNSTYHVTGVDGAYVRVTFEGTGIEFFAATRNK